ncbi:fimbrial protein [Xanthomonas sp. NCPPB 2632]|uniref:fimbrial protein n=1 Tax=Xanthomonas sp. NCPPB 2632 TaxID=3240912 RepID=UPI003512D31E
MRVGNLGTRRAHRGRVTLALAAALVSPIACADDTLDFEVTGAVIPSCVLSNVRLRIDLGSVTFADLGRLGATSTWRGGSFIGVDCIGASRATVTVRAPAYAPDPRYLAVAGGAGGVAIELRTGTDDAVLPDGTTPVGFEWGQGEARLAFEARYVRVGPLQAGAAGASAVVQIRWE